MLSLIKPIINLLDILTREIPPPKSKQITPAITPEPKLTPSEQEIISQAEQVYEAQFLQAPELLEVPEILDSIESIPTAAAPPAAPTAKTNRKQLTEGLLDEAWQQGHTTYAAMMGYVETHTGKGCSKRVIADWKKSRQLEREAA